MATIRLETADQEPLLPMQYFQPQKTNEFTKLMLAVLEDAIKCWQGSGKVINARSVSTARLRQRNEAAHWLFDSRYEGPFSFVHVCEALGYDPDYVRFGLKQGNPFKSHVHHVLTEARTQIRPERPHRRERA